MSLLRTLIPRQPPEQRAVANPLSIDDWISMFNFGNLPFMLYPSLGGKEEVIAETFAGFVQGAYKANGVIFACELARIMLFSEARFQFRQIRTGRPGDLFGSPALLPLEKPAPGRTTGDMLTRAMQHADFGGTAFFVRRGDEIRQPRPDWMSIILGSPSDAEVGADDLDAQVLGYLYHPGGRYSGARPVTLLADEVAVFAPTPDPLGSFRGIPWITPVIRNLQGHNAATHHKLRFFEHGATPQLVVSLDASITDPVKFRAWVEAFKQDHEGVTNAYKTLYLGAGAQATVVGKDLQQLDFKSTQGADETVIAAAAGVPPVVVGLSEGLQGSSLNAGNFASAMRRFADLTMRPAWRNVSGSLATLIDVPPGAELWYDDRDIPALKDDVKDAAEVQSAEAQSIRTLVDAGFQPESVVDAITAGDFGRLIHSQLYSVQLQAPGSSASTSEGQEPRGQEVRCPTCGKLLAEMASAPYRFTCPRCKAAVPA